MLAQLAAAAGLLALVCPAAAQEWPQSDDLGIEFCTPVAHGGDTGSFSAVCSYEIADDDTAYPPLQFNVDNREDTGLACDDGGNVVYVDHGATVSSDWFRGKYETKLPKGNVSCRKVWEPPPQPPAKYVLDFGDDE